MELAWLVGAQRGAQDGLSREEVSEENRAAAKWGQVTSHFVDSDSEQ